MCQCFNGIAALQSTRKVRSTKSSLPPNGEPAFCWNTFIDKPIEADENTIIEFFTDVEGNWSYFERFVESSKVLYWQQDEERGVWGPGSLELRDNCVLVFGGDAQDKGPGDIRFVKTLLSLKHRYPDRVGIILGNRDIDKLRFWAELDEDFDRSSFECWWLPHGVSYNHFVEEHTGKGLHLEKGRLAYLHWMLHCNMGCPDTTFGNRKKELAMIRGGRAGNEDVIESFRECVNPNGEDPWSLDLLRVGKLVIRIRGTIFVHADVNDRNIGYVPPHKMISNQESDDRAAKQRILSSFEEWADALNKWKDEELHEYMQHPGFYTKAQKERGGLALIDYCVPGGCNKRALAHANPFADGNSKLCSEKLEDQLLEWGIARVLSGHQPHGQSPSVVRHPQSGLLRITCDTSYSDMGAEKLSNRADCRGHVVAHVRIQGQITTIEGCLADGQKHQCVLHNDMTKDKLPHALVGRQLKDNFWIKAVLAKESKVNDEFSSNVGFLFAVLGQGHKLDTKLLGVVPCCLLLKDEFRTPEPELFNVVFNQFSGECFPVSTKSIADQPPDDFGHQPSLLRGSSAPAPNTAHMSYSEIFVDQCRMTERRRPSVQSSPAGVMYETTVFQDATLDDFSTYLIAPAGVLMHANDPGDIDMVGRKRSNEELLRETVILLNELIHRGKRLLFVSNNSNVSRRKLAHDQINLGIKLPLTNPEDHVISSASTCAWFLKQAGRKRPFILASHTGLLDELRQAGITDYVATINDDGTPKTEYLQMVNDLNSIMDLVERDTGIDAVVAGWDQQLSTLKIAVAAMYIRDSQFEIPLITCSIDNLSVLGGKKGDMVYGVGNGVIAKSICACLGKPFSFALDVGKSAATGVMLDFLSKSKEDGGYGVDFNDSVFIGDTLDTDIAMAHAVNMKSVLVFSGATSREDFEEFEDTHAGHGSVLPTYTCRTLADL